jgi:hypothetical protein
LWRRRPASSSSDEQRTAFAGDSLAYQPGSRRIEVRGEPYVVAMLQGFETRNAIVRYDPSTGRYEFETQILVRAARLGFRLAEVEIPTVYGEEKSHLSPFRDVPRIVGVLAGLTWEAVAPPAEMRRALAHAAARRGP